MITLTSSTQSAEEMREALEANGQQVVTDGSTMSQSGEPASEQTPDSPGESPSGKPESKTAPATTETGDKKPPVTQESKPGDETPGDEKPAEAKTFEPRRKQLERQVARLHEDLDLEKGSRAQLQTKLEAVQAELERIKPAEPAKADELVRPKRPTKADAEWDEEKLEQMLNEYDSQMDSYNLKMASKAASDALVNDNKRREAEAAQAESDRAHQEYRGRLQQDMEVLPDYKELFESLDGVVDTPPAVDAAIQASDHPGYLVHFLMKDVLDNDGKELAKIAAMNPVRQVRELTRLEARLEAEYAKPAEAVAEPVKAAKAAPVATEPVKAPEEPAKPAKRESKRTVEDPIETVGSRSAGATAQLAQATTFKEHVLLRRQGIGR